MSPQAAIFNIAIIVAIVGILVFWMRRFAVFRGYKDIEPDVLQVAELLKTQPVRERNDVVVAGYLGWLPTIVRFSKQLDTPGLFVQMRVPAAFNFTVLPKRAGLPGEGRVVMRTGSTLLDRKFIARSDDPLDVRMLLGTAEAREALEQLCCSSQTGLSLKEQTLELSEMAIPSFTCNHVLDHLHAMNVLATRIREMPGASAIRLKRLPATGSSWTIRLALAGGLICLIALLFAQPYKHSSAAVKVNSGVALSGVLPADAQRLPQLQGWHVARGDDFLPAGAAFLRNHELPLYGRVAGDFTGRGANLDSAYLLVNDRGQTRVSMIAGGVVSYDAIFPRIDALARIPKASMGKIKWKSAPQYGPDGDALLVIQNANDPTASLVLLRHGPETYSARPVDFTQIDLALQ
ncbi:MAG TPA: hypothetical protein VFP59_08480 [Candidatus Angelobacter sp.]|nr:hypothetical protein [Candidatus Angelobacter sp.]